MNLKDELKKYAIKKLDMDYVGVTSVDRLAGAPEGHRPADFLPGAKSVIAMAVRLSEGVIQTIFRAHEDGNRGALCVYGTHGYILVPNYHLYYAAYSIARFLEKKGHMSTPLPAGPGGGGAPFSLRHAAVAAGIGDFGWMGIVVTPDYGPRIREVAVITQAEIEPDPMYQGPKLCDPSKCNICVKVCPVGALSNGKSKEVVMGDRTFKYGYIDPYKCMVGTQGLTKKNLGLKDIPIPENPTQEDVNQAIKQLDPRQKSEQIQNAGSYYCGFCLAYCPIGKRGWPKTVSSRKL